MSLYLENIYVQHKTTAARLRATKKAYTDKSLKQEDRKYVEDNIFDLLYKFSDDEIVKISQDNGITPNVDRIKLIKRIIDKYNSYRDETLHEALLVEANRGNINEINILLKKGADYYYEAMFNAALGGHMKIVKLMR